MLTEGLTLNNEAVALAGAHQRLIREASERYPDPAFEHERGPEVDGTGWLHSLGSCARIAGAFPDAFTHLATTSDPETPGTF